MWTQIRNDDLKTDDLCVFLFHCAPGRLSWPPKLRNKLSCEVEAVLTHICRPGIDSQAGGIDSSESIPGIRKRLEIRALI
jgi:hypothetical protein